VEIVEKENGVWTFSYLLPSMAMLPRCGASWDGSCSFKFEGSRWRRCTPLQLTIEPLSEASLVGTAPSLPSTNRKRLNIGGRALSVETAVLLKSPPSPSAIRFHLGSKCLYLKHPYLSVQPRLDQMTALRQALHPSRTAFRRLCGHGVLAPCSFSRG
jgi:hypothetical protein